jgi:uncharacterized FAD-dependent dehydrogenase
MAGHLYRVDELRVPLDFDRENLAGRLAKEIRIPRRFLGGVRIVREAVDARKKPHLYYSLRLEFESPEILHTPLPHGVRAIERSALDIPNPSFYDSTPRHRPEPIVVVGAGPAGLFAALCLAERGVRVVLLERGRDVEARMKDIGALRAKGTLNPESNVCFGEGGAGAYTDGKLYTRIKHPFGRWVMKRLVEFGAPERILVDAHPHLGTDKLVAVIKNLRQRVIERGGEVRFECKVERLLLKADAVEGVVLSSGEEIPASAVVLAIGHSARDTLEGLHRDGVPIEAKGFAVGVRAEHDQALIDRTQYGSAEAAKRIGAAAYALTHQEDGRGVYSFCMCPGGFIVPSPTEPGRMVVNGMSNSTRSARFANSGVVVQVSPEDLSAHGYDESPLRGVAFQRDLEEAAFKAVLKPYFAPAMRVSDFVAGKATGKLAPTNFLPGIEAADFRELLPDWIANPLAAGLRVFDRRLRGYAGEDANLLGVESRTSAPIRMPRTEALMSTGVKGLYPVGEGAGYAGGIISAAVDGVRASEALLAERLL